MRQWKDEDITNVRTLFFFLIDAQEELIKMWQQKRREHTTEEWTYIFNMKNPGDMCLNEMLTQFRKDVPHSPMLPEYASSFVIRLSLTARSTTAPRYGAPREGIARHQGGAFHYPSRTKK